MWLNAIIFHRFGGSTGSLSSASPISEETGKAGAFSPEAEVMVSPVEGGLIVGPAPLQGQSVSMLKRHIRELYARLSKSEGDKQKIADEAYLRAVDIKKECDRKLEDARVAQGKQASLIDRLKVGSIFMSPRQINMHVSHNDQRD